jgi:hypothetical protein
MKIEFNEYIMETDSFGGFNLKRKATATKKEDGEQYEAEYIIGYNMQLKNCIEKIIHLNHCTKEDVVSLREYVKMYNNEINRLENLIKI